MFSFITQCLHNFLFSFPYCIVCIFLSLFITRFYHLIIVNQILNSNKTQNRIIFLTNVDFQLSLLLSLLLTTDKFFHTNALYSDSSGFVDYAWNSGNCVVKLPAETMNNSGFMYDSILEFFVPL
jgi:hypothetical protein